MAKNDLTSNGSESFWTYSRYDRENANLRLLEKASFAAHAYEYNGPEVSFPLGGERTRLHFFSCLVSAVFLISSVYFLIYFFTRRPLLKKVLGCSLIISAWMGYHFLVQWPGIIGYDGIDNLYVALSMDFSSFIQPLTTIINSAFFNFIPHYAWSGVFTIVLMMISFGLIVHHMTEDRKSQIVFGIIFLYFFYSPLNIFTNLFINRDTSFAWIFFITLTLPVVIAISRKKDAILMHFLFLFSFFISLEIRKEVAVLFPVAVAWSYYHLNCSRLKKSLMYAGFSIAIMFSFFGNQRFTNSISNPYYQSINLINPVADILSQKGKEILTKEERSRVQSFLDLDLLTKNYIRHDLSHETAASLKVTMSEDDFHVLVKLYFRLMRDYPGLWLENRVSVLLGSFGLNELHPNYATDIRTEKELPYEYDYNLHSLPFSSMNIDYPSILKTWKEVHWDTKYQLGLNRYVFLSFLIPLFATLFCLPFLKNAPASKFVLLLNIARIISITPFMPASYIKYSYTSYLLFLFLPLFVMAEMRSRFLHQKDSL